MKKIILICAVLYAAIALPAYAEARHNDKHAVDNMYTRALNNIEAAGMFDLLEPKKNIKISDMHIDHGQVFVTLDESTGSVVVVYDPIANKLVSNPDTGL